MADTITQILGNVTAYADAVAAGYTGTREQFGADQANFAVNAQEVAANLEASRDVLNDVNAAGTTQINRVTAEGDTQETRITNAGTTQVAAVNTAGTTQIGNVNTTGTNNVNAVNTAGTTQTNRVITEGDTQVARVAGLIDSKADKLTTYTSGNILVAGAGGVYADSGIPLRPQIESWADVQRVVRAGAAPNIFSIGEQLTCNRGADVLTWDIIGFDHDTPANPHLTHSMTLQMHDAYKNIQFSAPQALYYAETELPAGTYNFSLLAGYDVDYGGGKTYYFTLTQPVPVGGQIMFPWGYQVQSATIKISTYPSRTSTTAIESNTSVTEGTSGTALTPTNHTHRIRYGSNNWQQSALRQWLNSTAAAGSVWTPQTIYDRPPTWAASEAGFLNGLDADFLAVTGAVTKRTALNTVTDGGGYIDTSETFFLPAKGEVGGSNEGGINEGVPYQYYADMLTGGVRNDGEIAARIKYLSGTARLVWLRSPAVGNAHSVRYVNTSGAVSSYSAYDAFGVSPLVNIV